MKDINSKLLETSLGYNYIAVRESQSAKFNSMPTSEHGGKAGDLRKTVMLQKKKRMCSFLLKHRVKKKKQKHRVCEITLTKKRPRI